MDGTFPKERQTIDQHPLPEQIVAYHERRLPPDEAEEIRAHLVECPDCTTQLLALADLFDDEDGAATDIAPVELDAAWQRQRERLFPAAPVVPMESRRERKSWMTAAPFALAASLLAVVTLVQWRTNVRLEQPRANPPLVNLEPVDSIRRGTEAVPELQLAEDTEWVWVILNPSPDLEAGLYEVEVVGPKDERSAPLKVRAREARDFRFQIPSSAFSMGNNKISLFEIREGQRWLLAEFELGVRPPASSTE